MKVLWNDDSGQDLLEYTLLLAALVLGSAAVLVGLGGTVSALWSIINSRLASANQTK